MKRFFIIIIGFLLLPLCSKASDDFYSKIYDEIKKSKYETPLDRSSSQLGISSDELLGILNDKTELSKICKQLGKNEIHACYNEASQLFLFEKEVAEIEATEKIHAQATEMWMNGTLNDNDKFDVVVDLNIIDVIYFGKAARIPTSQEFNIFDDNDDDKSDETPEDPEAEKDFGAIDLPTYEVITEPGEEESSDETENNEEEENEKITEEPTEEDYSKFICQDPDALFFGSGENKSDEEITSDDNSISPDSSDNKNNSKSSDKTTLRAGVISGADNHYLGSTYPTFGNEDMDSEDTCDGDEVEMFGNMFCIPKFCDNVLCIEIEFIAGRTPDRTTGTGKEDCIKCLVDYASNDIEESYRVKDRLNPESHSTKHFWSRIWPPGELSFHIDVFTKPTGVAERITREKDMTLIEEYRSAMADSISQGSAAFVASDGSVDVSIDNKALLVSIIGNECLNYLNTAKAHSALSDIAKNCQINLENSQSALIQTNKKIREFIVKYTEKKQQERKIHRWEEIIKNGFENFASQAKTINKIFRALPSKKDLVKKEISCKNR